ncbi:alcohol dehydrogenase [Cylindrobasidium torrendii FP15055 ss-10]|uniref:Alcohol dehydrogenase n=1 Tax=Cylindrobasidium torrendii FP15055 ss-10 TaxID=1314674 RepID=A0A0D7B5N6_9AGAR|nr:alcohol dehydrogenase [Cylindrobasidium torrendii FP15055 ss-10]
MYRRIVLNERPGSGPINDKTFRQETESLDTLVPGKEETLVKVLYFSLDPAMRGWLNDSRSYVPPVQISETMRAHGLAQVVKAGEGSKFKVGDLVSGMTGWSEYRILADKDTQNVSVPPGAEPLDALNNLGFPGLTAYFGLKDICQVKQGETLVVSGAAGAVGSLACQLGKRWGARVVAFAGTDEKCDWLVKEIGVDVALNYKSPSFAKDFREVGLVNAYFDNVGGEILDLVLTRLAQGARIALCGAISDYNGVNKGLRNYLSLISMRAKIEGFIVFDYAKRYSEGLEEIARGLGDGSIKRKFHIVEGLENAPTALPLLFSGGNTGKLVIKVAGETNARL